MAKANPPTTAHLLDLLAFEVERVLLNEELEPKDLASLGNLILRMRIRDDIQEEKQTGGLDIAPFPALPPRQLELFNDANDHG